MPGGEEFSTRDPYLEDVEMFGLQKQRPDTPIGDDGEIHRLDNMNFSGPRPDKRDSHFQPETLLTIIEEFSPFVQEVQVPSPAGLVCLWHIARISHTFGKTF